MAVVVYPVVTLPQTSEGFYAINNQFQMNGPKGFTECKMVHNGCMFVRMDLPGVQEELLSVSLHPAKKTVIIEGSAPVLDTNDSGPRKYSTLTKLACNCCEISGFTSHLSNGVLRLLISKTPISPFGPEEDIRLTCPHRFLSRTDPNDPALTGPVLQLHPGVSRGPAMACEFKELQGGGLYVRVDMPGVPNDNVTVSVMNGRVRVTGQAPAVGYDSAGRFYSGEVAMLSPPADDLPSPHIIPYPKDGVIRLLIRPH